MPVGSGTAISSNSSSVRAYALGLGYGGLIMIFFGLAWWGIASQGIAYSNQLLYWGVIYVIAIALLALTIVFMIGARRLPRDTSPEAVARGRVIGRRLGIQFGIIFGLEIIIAVVVNVVLNIINHQEFFFPLLAIIVGAHFLPLAPIFQVRVYYATGILLCLVGLVVLLATPSTAMMNGARLWDVLPGILSAPILWLTALYDLFESRRVVLQARKALPA